MSSSSSSDFENECFYGGFSTSTPWPMQPLIYYTHVPNRRNQGNRESGKRNPNCFVKAFRWYTQERYPCKRTDSMTTNAPNIKGFAVWLDEKYHEFLQENRNERTKYTMKQTSTVEIETMSNNFPRETSATNKFKRRKSTRKRHRKLTNNDTGNFSLKSKKSLEILLYPKHLSRSASECCLRGHSCCINCTSFENTRLKRKSQSMTSLHEKEVCIIPYDVIRTDCLKDKENRDEVEKVIATIVEQNDNETYITTKTIKEKEHKYPKLKNISCQCVNKSVTKVDAHCQCEISNSSMLTKQTTFSKKQENKSHEISTEVHLPCKCNDKIQEVATVQQKISKINQDNIEFIQGTQTSDYSIQVPSTYQYPFFMKIVCPNNKN